MFHGRADARTLGVLQVGQGLGDIGDAQRLGAGGQHGQAVGVAQAGGHAAGRVLELRDTGEVGQRPWLGIGQQARLRAVGADGLALAAGLGGEAVAVAVLEVP